MIEDKTKAIEAGMNGHLSKPVRRYDLFHALVNWLHTPQNITLTDKTNTPKTTQPLLDEHDGLGIVNGNQALYQRLLQQFLTQLSTRFSRLPNVLRHLETDHQAWSNAQQQNHALKGVSANLALGQLAQLTTQIDQRLKAHDALDTTLIDALESTLHATQAEIERYLEQRQVACKQETHSAEANPDAIKQVLTDLAEQIKNNEFISQPELDQAAAVLAHWQPQPWQKLTEALNSLDYDNAQKHLNEIERLYTQMTLNDK